MKKAKTQNSDKDNGLKHGQKDKDKDGKHEKKKKGGNPFANLVKGK